MQRVRTYPRADCDAGHVLLNGEKIRRRFGQSVRDQYGERQHSEVKNKWKFLQCALIRRWRNGFTRLKESKRISGWLKRITYLIFIGWMREDWQRRTRRCTHNLWKRFDRCAKEQRNKIWMNFVMRLKCWRRKMHIWCMKIFDRLHVGGRKIWHAVLKAKMAQFWWMTRQSREGWSITPNVSILMNEGKKNQG